MNAGLPCNLTRGLMHFNAPLWLRSKSFTVSTLSTAEDVEVSTYYCSRPRSAPMAACETTCGVQAGVIRVQGPPSDSSTVPCRHVSTHVNEFHTTPSSLGRSRGSCGAAIQNNKIRKAKFSRICSINLELTTDDRSRRFYFNKQFQWMFESWTVLQNLELTAYVTVICQYSART